MNLVILDTDVCSFFFKQDTRSAVYRPYLEGRTAALSFMTVAEMYQWAFIRNWGKRRVSELEKWLQQFLVLPFSADLCERWAYIRVERRKIGQPISPGDAWVAATALVYESPLLTHNRDDFLNIAELALISQLD